MSPEDSDALMKELSSLFKVMSERGNGAALDRPFSSPYHWAGFQVIDRAGPTSERVVSGGVKSAVGGAGAGGGAVFTRNTARISPSRIQRLPLDTIFTSVARNNPFSRRTSFKTMHATHFDEVGACRLHDVVPACCV